jgi:DNA polymerase III delta prime subunit
LFICNDPYTKGLKDLRLKARVLNFGRIKTDRLSDALRRICLTEKMTIGNEDLLRICELNQNDVRSSVSMLEFICRNAGEGVSIRGNYYLNLEAMQKIVWEKK